MARQPGWGLAGPPCPAETWPVPGALAGGVMRVDRAELITTQPLPEPGSGTRMQEGGRAGRQSASGRFQAEGPEPLAQVTERIQGVPRRAARGWLLPPPGSGPLPP